jgi:hypothetical protein
MAKSDLEKEVAQRLADARRQKSLVESNLREAYFFTDPQRYREVSSRKATSDSRPDDANELSTSLGMEVAQDFATEMINTFMPSIINWADQKASVDIPEDRRDEIEEIVSAQTLSVMQAIKQSNFYDTAAMGFTPDLSLGTVALWIEDKKAHRPIETLSVPIRELEINVGPNGDVDDRFVVRHTRYRHVKALLPGVTLPDDVVEKIKKKPQERCEITWGFWRNYDRDDETVWKSVIMIGPKLVFETELVGEGSCPLIVGRFNPDTMFPHGRGPAIKALPELLQLDETEVLTMESADASIHPAFAYQDDGVLNLSDGIEAGQGYVARSWGPGGPVHRLTPEGNVQFAEYRIAKIESRIRRLFFVDFPEQAGKTPPTAEQWIDEMVRAKRRIGTPGRVFWKEVPAEVFKRFKWLLEKRGTIEPITVDGKQLALVPYDPTEQAQEHQEVNVANRILEMARNHFPQMLEVMVDGPATLKTVKEKLRDKIVVLRKRDQMQQAAELIAATQGGGGMGGGPEGAM